METSELRSGGDCFTQHLLRLWFGNVTIEPITQAEVSRPLCITIRRGSGFLHDSVE